MNNFNLCVFNSNFELIGIVDKIISFQVTNNFNTPSTFTLNLILDQENSKILNVDNYLMQEGQNTNNTDMFIIEYKSISLNNNGQYELTIKGRNLVAILERRLITKLYNVVNTAVDPFIKELISNELITASDQNRNVNNTTYNLTNINTLISYSESELYTNLLTAITSIIQSVNLGIQVTYSFFEKGFIINLLQGTNRSIEQNINNPIILSNDLNTLMGESFLHTKKNYINSCYVYGSVGKDNTQETLILNDNIQGLNRYEGATDSDVTGLTSSNYESAFKNIGDLYIESQDLYKCFNGNFNSENKIFQFKKDFNVGDYITCINQVWGLNETLQITQAQETWSNNGYNLVFQLGKPLPTLSQHLQSLKERRN